MNFANAAMLTVAVFGFVQLLKSLLPTAWVAHSQVVVLLVLVSAFAAVFLVAETVWAHSQLLGETPLDLLSTWDKILASLFLAGTAAFGDQFLKAVRNIGENQPPPPQQPSVTLRGSLTAGEDSEVVQRGT